MHYEFWYYNSRVGKYRNCQIMPCYLLLYLEGLIRIQYTYRCSQKLNFNSKHQSVSSVAQSCLTLCDPMNCSTPGFPVHHQWQKLAQTHVHRVVMPPNHLILCHPLVLPPSIFPNIRVFSNESALCISGPSIGVSASTSVLPMNTQD